MTAQEEHLKQSLSAPMSLCGDGPVVLVETANCRPVDCCCLERVCLTLALCRTSDFASSSPRLCESLSPNAAREIQYLMIIVEQCNSIIILDRGGDDGDDEVCQARLVCGSARGGRWCCAITLLASSCATSSKHLVRQCGDPMAISPESSEGDGFRAVVMAHDLIL